MIRKLIALLPLAIASAAYAADTGSEYMHQTAASKWEVTPQIEYHDWTVKSYNAAPSKVEISGMSYSVKGEYGINDMFSVGAKLGMNSDSWKYTYDTGTAPGNSSTSGLNNIDIFGLGKTDLAGGTFRYGLDFAVSTAKHKFDTTSNTYSIANDTGGTSLTPFIGWEMAMGPGTLGAKFSYSFLLTDRKYDVSPAAGTNIDSDKGVNSESLAVFYEWMMNNWSLGVSVAWNGVSGSKATTVNGATGDVDSGHAGILVDVYAPITLADNITLLPQIGFGDPGTAVQNIGGVKTDSGWDLGVGCRFAF